MHGFPMFLIRFTQFGREERILCDSRPQLDELSKLMKDNPLARDVQYFTLTEITPGATQRAARPPSKQKALADATKALRARGATDQELLVFFQASAAAMRQGTGLGGTEISVALGLVDE